MCCDYNTTKSFSNELELYVEMSWFDYLIQSVRNLINIKQ